MPTTIKEVKSKVKKGAKLLDEMEPLWYKKVNLEELEMGSCRKCVLGQLYESFGSGCLTMAEHLKIDIIETLPGSYGFDITGVLLLKDHPNKNTYSVLREEWINQIVQRRNQND